MTGSDDHSWLKGGSTSAADVKRSYDDWAANYDETLESWDYRAPEQAAAMLRGEIATDAVILDAGCGTGLTGSALRAAGFVGPIDGIDLSPASLELTAKRGVYRKLSEADLQSLPLPLTGDSYDAAICVGVLTYIPDAESLLREFARLVRSGGRILVTQRDDLFRARDYDGILAALGDVAGDVTVTDALPYLPDNPDFGKEIGVVHVLMEVS